MIDALRSEWIKVRTVRMNWVLVVIGVAFPLAVSVLTAMFFDSSELTARDMVDVVAGTSAVTAMLLGVVAATGIAGEFGFGTIRPTFASVPRRGVVVAAKAAVSTAVAVAVSAIVVVGTWLIADAVASARDVTLSFDDVPTGSAALVGVVCFTGIVALFGFGLGLLTRNSPAAVTILILWPLLVENLLTGLLTVLGVDNARKLMPYQQGFRLGNPLENDPELLDRVPAGLYFLGFTLVLVVVAAALTEHRDA